MIAPGKYLLISGISALALNACGKSGESASIEPMLEALAPAEWSDAAARFVDRDGAEIGYAVFTDGPGAGVLIRIDLKGLPPGWHGMHLHQTADCSDYADGFLASGGHVDPDAHEHGLLNMDGAERADLPNIYAGADGRATVELFNDGVALYPSEAAAAEAGPWPLMDDDGFAVIIHAAPDDHMTQPIGGAGERIACAAIKGAP